MLLKLFIFSVSYLTVIALQPNHNLPFIPLTCPLEWKPHNQGNPFPSDHIPLNSKNRNPNAITRTKLFGKNILAFLDKNQIAHSIRNGQHFSNWSYDVLTNPHNCLIEWVPSHNKSMVAFSVNISTDSTSIGRKLSSTQWQLCTISQGKCAYNNSGNMQKTPNFHRLLSYTPLSMKFTNLSYTVVEDFFDIQVIGTDMIQNKADVSLRQSISHSKMVTKTLNWDFDFMIKIQGGLSLNIMKNWLDRRAPDLAGYIAFGQKRATLNGRVTTVSVTVARDIDVPARTSVESISTVVIHDFVLIITGQIEFSAVGRNATDILSVLSQAGLDSKNMTLNGDKVLMTTNSTLRGSAPSQSEFLVLPYNSYKGSTAVRMMEDWKKKKNHVGGMGEEELFNFIESHIN